MMFARGTTGGQGGRPAAVPETKEQHMAELGQMLKDAAYVGVGFGVLTFQRAQVRRQEITKAIEAQLGDARTGLSQLSGTVEDRVKVLEERLEGVQEQLETALGELEANVEKALDELSDRLPDQARDALGTARTAAREATTQLRSLVA